MIEGGKVTAVGQNPRIPEGAVRVDAKGLHVYPGLIDALVLDESDAADADTVAELGVRPIVAKTLMHDATTRRALAEAALNAVTLA